MSASEREDLPVPFDPEIHRPAQLGFERARNRRVLINALADGVRSVTKAVLDGLFR
jgi:hypothetical protein